ncbi:hypothetical protein BPTFM16_01029 [Altererythrobacter insulae]|nr:hypothetical protein BPTFM16_01029 [Altererythrobacter insulae]
MLGARNTRIIFALCAIAWAVLVARAVINVKGPEDFVVTSSMAEVQSFARQELRALQQPSIADDTERCGIIFEDSDGELGVTGVVEGEQASCGIAFFDLPGMAPIASFHTHAAYSPQFDSEVPSLDDMQSDIANRMHGFVSTPGGRMWWIDWETRRANLICGEGCLPRDPNYVPCTTGQLPQSFTPEELRNRFQTASVRC